MKNLIRIIKSIQLKQTLTVFIASSLLFVSTACSQGNIAQAGGQTYTETAKRAMSDTYDDYDANQSFQGGMNGYNDDRRYDAETAAKAKTLVDTAKRRQGDNVLERSVFNEDVREEATEIFSRKLEKSENKLERNKNKAVEYIDDKSDNLKRNLEKVPGGVKNTFEGAVDTAENAVEDATQAAAKNAKRVKNNFQDLEDDIS